MGLKLKSDLNPQIVGVPGPGSYSQNREKLKQSAPCFGFGTSKRPDITGPMKLKTPGPGEYTVAPKIGNANAKAN